MIDMVRRHEIQVQRQAGRSLVETAARVGVSRSSVQRVVAEPPVTSFDTAAERTKLRIGRPSKAELVGQPDVLAVELLRRAKNQGYITAHDFAAVDAVLDRVRAMLWKLTH